MSYLTDLLILLEFFMHGKVATQKLPQSGEKTTPVKGVIKRDAKSIIKKSKADTIAQ